MTPIHAKAIAGVAVVGAIAAAAWAASPDPQSQRQAQTPPGWSYDIKNGKRVPRVERKTNADGSWTEQYREGNCMVTRTGRDGEVRETRKCD
jgi:hypothetical protein